MMASIVHNFPTIGVLLIFIVSFSSLNVVPHLLFNGGYIFHKIENYTTTMLGQIPCKFVKMEAPINLFNCVYFASLNEIMMVGFDGKQCVQCSVNLKSKDTVASQFVGEMYIRQGKAACFSTSL